MFKLLLILLNNKLYVRNDIFHNGSNYDYHLIIKELAEEFKNQFTCLAENTEKYITFTFPIEEQVTRFDKNGEEFTKNISYILQSIDSARFMASSLSNIVNNPIIFLKEFIELNVNSDTMIKNKKHVELNIFITTAFLNVQTLKMI